ncbi:ABC transporter permease [Haloferax sp. MBLA0077]|uniref:ABC transporter permease n=3 Tax=Haloferacaceae TaxID=1644056 RepID=A0A6G1Z5Y2_9EURY|nr:ABC transporter permease [Haloferax sp. CBA1149]MRW81969.1 ABC transporter permease [Haloferax marinisediminis]
MMLFVLDNLIWPILLVAFILFSVLLPEIFTQYRNIQFLLYMSAGLGAITLAEAICLISGNFDLSVGSVAGFSSMFTALFLTKWFSGAPSIVGILVILAIGGLIGFMNGFFIAKFDVNPFLQTLSALIVFEGGILVLSTRSVYDLPQNYLWLGGGEVSLGGLLPQPVPVAVIFILGLFVAVWFVLMKTRFGRAVYAVGGDEESSAEAGIDTDRIVISVFVLSGMLAATGGLLLTGFNGGATPTLGTAQLFPAFTAAVIGGVSLFGGRGNVFNALGGVLLLSTIAAGLVMLNIDPQIVQTINGLVLFAAILLYTFVQKTRGRLLSDL